MKLDYQVIYSDRRTIGITVERDNAIVVRAPNGTSDDVVRRAIESKRLWLFEKVGHRRKYPAQRQRKEFVSGETLAYLGRNYRLEISDEPMEGVRFDHKFIIGRTQKNRAGELLRDWYVEKAEQRIRPTASAFAQSLGVTFNRVLISDLRYRWGSCTPKNNLNFNWRIMKAPAFVIDYLVVHELAHLLEPNHTPRFWTIVAIQAPQYLEAREWLIDNGHLLEIEL